MKESAVPTQPVKVQRRVYHVGPEPANARSRGGMATVMDLIARHPDARFSQIVVPTSHNGHPLLRRLDGIRGLVRAGSDLSRRRVDVMHVHLSFKGSVVRKGLLLHLARRSGVPTVVHAHSGGFAQWFDSLPGWRKVGVRWLLAPGEHWLVLGEKWRVDYVRMLGLNRNSVDVLPNPVDCVALSPKHHVPRPKDGPLRALFLGNLLDRKGVFDIVAAVAALQQRSQGRISVVMAGDGAVEEVRAAVERAAVSEQFTFPGWVDSAQRAELLRSADVLLLPSHREALPMSLLEAMASGLAVVTCPVGSIPDVVQHDHNGLLLAPGDVTALAASLQRLIEEDVLVERFGAAARQRAEDFDLGKWYVDLAEVWDRAIDTSR